MYREFLKFRHFFGRLRVKTIVLLKKSLKKFEIGLSGLGKNYLIYYIIEHYGTTCMELCVTVQCVSWLMRLPSTGTDPATYSTAAA